MNGRVGATLAMIDQQQGGHRGDGGVPILVQQRAQASTSGTEQCQARGQAVASTSHYVTSKRRLDVYLETAQTNLTDFSRTSVVVDDSMPTSDVADRHSKIRSHYGLHIH